MTIAKQALLFEFGSVKQERGDRHLQLGELTDAINVRQIDSGPYIKRRGYDRTVPTFSGGSWTAPAESLLPGDGVVPLARDSADRAWAYDPDLASFNSRGLLKRFFPRTEVTIPVEVAQPSPVIVEAAGQLWTFIVGGTGGNGYTYTVTDASTGIVIVPATFVSVTSLASIAAAYDGTSVWAFYVTSGTTVGAAKFSPASPSSAPTVTTYFTGAVGSVFIRVDAMRLSAVSETAVVVGGKNATGAVLVQSYLDPATGASRASPAAVTNTYGVLPAQVQQVSILVSSGSTTWYYTGNIDLTTTSTLRLIDVTSATLATATDTLITTVVTGTNVSISSSGYLDGGGARVVFFTSDEIAGDVQRVQRYSTASGITTIARGAWIASKPAAAPGAAIYYILTGYDDVGVATASVQRSMYLRDTDGNIVAQMLYGVAPVFGHSGSPALTQNAHTTPLLLVGTKLISVTGSFANSFVTLSTTQISIETAEVFGKPVMFGNKAFVPGGIPVVFSRLDSIHEAGPLLFPSYVRRSAGPGGATVYTAAAAVYRFTDADGVIWRSSPVTAVITAEANATLEAPSLRHVLAGTTCVVEFYVQGTGSTANLTLQGTAQNTTTADVVTFTLGATAILGEVLYTTGGALSASPPPAAKAVSFWRNRIFVSQGSTLFFSQEIEGGFGTRFNEVLSLQWTDGTGDILAIGVVDWNYLALFKRDAIGVISGAGPDGRGQGNYIVQTLTTKLGCSATGSIVSGPAGCYFQDINTGRACCVLPALQGVEIMGGTDDYATETITAAAHVEQERQVQFHTNGPRMLIVDYRHPTQGAPNGQCYSWSGTGLLQGYGACVINSGPLHIESAGTLRQPGTGYQDATSSSPASYFMRLVTGHMAPGNLQGEFLVSRVGVLNTFRATHDLRITTFPDYSASGTAVTKAITAAPEQIYTRPPGSGRIQAMRVQIEELASTGQGFEFNGLALEIQSRGRMKHLNTSQVV